MRGVFDISVFFFNVCVHFIFDSVKEFLEELICFWHFSFFNYACLCIFVHCKMDAGDIELGVTVLKSSKIKYKFFVIISRVPGFLSHMCLVEGFATN
jgi:hypothetical protein